MSETLIAQLFRMLLDTLREAWGTRMSAIEHKQEAMMAKIIDLENAQAVAEAKQAELETAQADAFRRIDEDFAEIRRLLAEQPAGGITEEQLEPLLARMQANTSKVQVSIDALKAVDPNPAFPAAPPVEPTE